MKVFELTWSVIKKICYVLEAILTIFWGMLAVLLGCSVFWMFKTWPKLNMDELLYQLNAPMEGTDLSMIK